MSMCACCGQMEVPVEGDVCALCSDELAGDRLESDDGADDEVEDVPLCSVCGQEEVDEEGMMCEQCVEDAENDQESEEQ